MTRKNNNPMVILASRSARRIELLKQVGIECIVLPADIDETVRKSEQPESYVKRLAKAKALTTASKMKSEYAHLPVLAADTAVSLHSQIFGKPDNDAEAYTMLKQLSGKKHLVHTAVAACYQGKVKVVLSTSVVEMMRLDNDVIQAYIASGEHRDKAGSYGIQGKAATWIKHIEGSYSGVMGLPLFETVQLINKIIAK